MSDEADITINGASLTEEESAIMRMAVETFVIVMSQGLEENEPGIVGALSEQYLEALVKVQRLLDIRPERIQ